MKRAIFILLLAALSLPAQIGGPVAGTVYDGHERALRPVIGTLGAAYLGLPLTGKVDAAAVSPDGRLAVVAEGGNLLVLRGIDTGQVQSAGLPRGFVTPDRIAWSADSITAAVVAGDRLLVYSGLDRGPAGRTARTASRTEVTRALSVDEISLSGLGAITALAVDDSRTVLVGANGGLYRVKAGGDRSLIASAGSVSSVQITGNRLLVADRGWNEVLEIGNWRESADVKLFANQGQGVDDPVGVALARDGRSLWVAGGTSRSLARFDLTSRRMMNRMELGFEPTRLSPIGGGTVLLLNERASETEALQALEDGPEAKVYFVPAASAAQLSAVNSVEE